MSNGRVSCGRRAGDVLLSGTVSGVTCVSCLNKMLREAQGNTEETRDALGEAIKEENELENRLVQIDRHKKGY